MDARSHLLPVIAAGVLATAVSPVHADPSTSSATGWSGGGPDVGFVNAIRRASPNGPIYAGTYGGGVFRSDDGGLSWSDFSGGTVDGAVVLEIETTTVDGQEFVFLATENLGLWRWRSRIGLWEDLNSGMGGQGPLAVRGVELHPFDPKVLTVATATGVFTSSDGGRSWPDSLRFLPGSTFEDVGVSPSKPNTIFGLESFSLFETPDRGDQLFDIGAGLPGKFNWDFEFHGESTDSLLVLTLDDGLYFSEQRNPFTRIGPTQNPTAGIRAYDLEVTRRGGWLLVGSERGLHISEDMGQNWLKHNPFGGQLWLPEIWAVAVEREEPLELLLGSFRFGLLRTGATPSDWTEQNAGLRAAWIEGLHAWEGNVVATTAHGRIYHSTDHAQSWVERTGDLDAIRQHDFHRIPSSERWLVATVSGVWLSDDMGESWRAPSDPPAEDRCRRFLQPPWEAEGTFYLTTFRGVWLTTDAGESWSLVADGLPAGGNFQAAGAGAGDRSLFFGALGDAVYRSVDGGAYQALPNSAFGSRVFRDFAFPAGDGSQLIVAARGSLDLWDLTAGGEVRLRRELELELPRSPGIDGPNVEAILHDPASGTLYAGLAEDGLWRSTDGGHSWERFDEGVRVPRVEALALIHGERRLYLGTAGSGVYSRRLDTELSAPGDPLPPAGPPEEAAPSVFVRLRPLDANPVRGDQARFELSLGRAARSTVGIYDARGRRVREIQPGFLGLGSHELRWNLRDDAGSAVANGVYWIRAEANGRVVSSKLALSR